MNELGSRFLLGLTLALSLAGSACGEGGADGGGGDASDGATGAATTGETTGATTGSTTSSTTTGSAATSGSSSTSSGGGGATSTGTGQGGATTASSGSAGGEPEGLLVINELSADGDDWIELFNAGEGDLDLSGLRIADQETPGVPKLADAMTIPDGTTLEAGAYLFILGDQDPPADGFTDVCEPGPAPCLQAGFGLSQGNGDEVFVVDTGDAVLVSVVYPADAAVEGESWGRLPNGSGEFAVAGPTPGAESEAP